MTKKHPKEGEEGFRQYVAGFLLYRDMVLLVRKEQPSWQKGFMNAIGGQMEPGETAYDAMRREFDEEAQLNTDKWDLFAIENGPGYRVYFFRCTITGSYIAPTINDSNETLEWCDPRNQKFPQIGNLNWLLPMALDPRPLEVTIHTTGDIRRLMTW